MGVRRVATEFQSDLRVSDDEASHRGQTMVTLEVDGSPHHLFPEEALALARHLGHAAAMAAGEPIPSWAEGDL